ncbi:hypothetical protein T05_4271 [Trichinella murrelli]|uniref:Uncharacterized protein n=1 Tax=Trichinella murrelli TaxID=144512 RepID=A0A0V0TQE1_9BILA|nr:hypothetical protein T05_4271 [Trichinella murrelli]
MTMEVAHGMVVAKIRSFSSFMMHNCAGELWKQVEFFILRMEKMFTAAPKAIKYRKKIFYFEQLCFVLLFPDNSP